MQADKPCGWWSRPSGGREVLVVALPLILSTVSWTVMNFVDRMFLFYHSAAEMAAAMPAGLLHFTMLCFFWGTAGYVNTFVAQYEGAGKPHRIGLVVAQGIRIGLLATPLFLLSIPLAGPIFRFAAHDPHVVLHEIVYFQSLAFGAGGTIVAIAISSFFSGRGDTRTVMYVDSSAAALNVLLDYLWIFGHAGFPELGIEGAGIATAVCQWAKAAAYWVLMNRPQYRERYALRAGRRFDRALFGRLIYYGGPSGLQMLIELSAITLFIMLVGRLGEFAMVTTTLAFNVNSVAFVPVLGLGIAVSTLVGQRLGADQPHLAARATWTSVQIAMGYCGLMAILYVAAPDLFLLAHAQRDTAESFAPTRDQVVILLRFVAAYCVLEAAEVLFASAIKGAGDTRFVLLNSIVTAPLPILCGYVGVRYYSQGLIYCWWVITLWIMLLSVVFCLRFLQGHWRSMRVIEADTLPDLVTASELSASKPIRAEEDPAPGQLSS